MILFEITNNAHNAHEIAIALRDFCLTAYGVNVNLALLEDTADLRDAIEMCVEANGHYIDHDGTSTVVIDPWPITTVSLDIDHSVTITDYLLRDGNFKVPASRWATDSNDVAQVVELIAAAEQALCDDINGVEHLASMVVNDSDEIEQLFDNLGIYHRPWQ